MLATISMPVIVTGVSAVLLVGGYFFLRFRWRDRDGGLDIQRWVDVAQRLSQNRKIWRQNDKKAWYALDIESGGSVEFIASPGGVQDRITVTLNDTRVVAALRMGSLMFLKFDGETLDDTTRDYRYTQSKWVKIMNFLRKIAGEDAVEAESDPDSVKSRSQEEIDRDRLKLAEKRAARGGKAVTKAERKLAERHSEQD